MNETTSRLLAISERYCGVVPRVEMSNQEVAVALIERMREEVSNGGFAQLFLNCSDLISEFRDKLGEVDERCLEFFVSAHAIVTGEKVLFKIPVVGRSTAGRKLGLTTEQDAALLQLSREFWDYSSSLDRRLLDYCRTYNLPPDWSPATQFDAPPLLDD